MVLWGSKKEDENQLGERENISSRNFRDLNPENQKKRKEPVKPWGKPERLLVAGVLGGTILISVILAVSARDWKLPGFPRLRFAFPKFNFFEGETVILEKGKVSMSGPEEEKIKKTLSSFKNLTNNLSGVYGLYVIRFNSGVSYGVYEKETFSAGSVLKLPELIALYQDADSGKINLDTKYILKEADKRDGAGSLIGMPAGTVLTYRALAKLAANESDNTASGVIKNLLGENRINKLIADLGMKTTKFANDDTTPYDIGLLLQKLYGGKILSDSSKEEILGYLTSTTYKDWLNKGVPDNVRVAHKYGREQNVVNDVGIVYAKNPFVVVIMSKGVVEAEADNVFPSLARLIYEAEAAY